MSHHPQAEALKSAGDIAASAGSTLVVLSHWSEILTPIVALAVGLLTLAWWIIRLRDRFVERREES